MRKSVEWQWNISLVTLAERIWSSYDSWAWLESWPEGSSLQECSRCATQQVIVNVCCSSCATINLRRCNLLSLVLEVVPIGILSHLLRSHNRAWAVKHQMTKLRTPSWTLMQRASWCNYDRCYVTGIQGQPWVVNFCGSMWKQYTIVAIYPHL